GPAAGKAGDVHHHRSDCVCGRPEYPDFPPHDGDGEDPRHRRAHIDGYTQIAGAPAVYHARIVDWRDRHCDWFDTRLRALLGGRPLSLAVAGSRGLLNRLRALRATCDWRRTGCPGCHRDFPDRHAVSLLVGGPDSARGSPPLRVTL